MDWLIFWGIVVLYWIVAIKRIPVYYRRIDANEESLCNSEKDVAWAAILFAAIWPYYEACRWIQNTVIHSMTAEERKRAEFEKAEKIVAEYTARKIREDKEAFERELRGS